MKLLLLAVFAVVAFAQPTDDTESGAVNIELPTAVPAEGPEETDAAPKVSLADAPLPPGVPKRGTPLNQIRAGAMGALGARTMGARTMGAPLRTTMGAAPLRTTMGAAPLRTTTGAAPLRTTMGAAPVRTMGTPLRTMGAAPVRTMGAAPVRTMASTAMAAAPVRTMASAARAAPLRTAMAAAPLRTAATTLGARAPLRTAATTLGARAPITTTLGARAPVTTMGAGIRTLPYNTARSVSPIRSTLGAIGSTMGRTTSFGAVRGLPYGTSPISTIGARIPTSFARPSVLPYGTSTIGARTLPRTSFASALPRTMATPYSVAPRVSAPLYGGMSRIGTAAPLRTAAPVRTSAYSPIRTSAYSAPLRTSLPYSSVPRMGLYGSRVIG